MAFEEWRKKMRKLRPIITFDELCEDFGVETLNDFQERLLGYSDGVYHQAYTEARKNEELSEEECEEEGQRAEAAELGEAIEQYSRAALSVAKKLYKEHNLILTERDGEKNAWTYLIEPEISWKNSASKIVETINGVGMFRFNDAQDLMRSGPYTARQAVLSHLHHIPSHPEVYEGTKAKYLIERAQR
jgi:hypothetical protein